MRVRRLKLTPWLYIKYRSLICTYSVQSTERDINGQREEILDHFLKSFHQLLLICLDLLWLEAQQNPHGYAEHQTLHLWVDQDTGIPR